MANQTCFEWESTVIEPSPNPDETPNLAPTDSEERNRSWSPGNDPDYIEDANETDENESQEITDHGRRRRAAAGGLAVSCGLTAKIKPKKS